MEHVVYKINTDKCRYAGRRTDDDVYISLQKYDNTKFENTIEAQVQNGDTLQAIALRFHCSVADIKRLNKIDKANEIFARKVIKVPITTHSILLETNPIVHKSGQSSPKQPKQDSEFDHSLKNNNNFNEKLLVAAVNSSQAKPNESINNIILNSKLIQNVYVDTNTDHTTNISEPLLSGVHDESLPHPMPIPGPAKSAFDWSGSDCDISWICLFIFILALCFAIPLVYIFYVAEHPEKFRHNAT